jgi:hypothetical protein
LAANFPIIRFKQWICGNRDTHHLQAVRTFHLRRISVRRDAAWYEAHTHQAQRVRKFLRQPQMPEMDGVERSAEDSKSGQCQIRGAPKDKDEG